PDSAISSFREYLRQGKDVTPAQRAQVEGYIREMEELKKKQADAATPKRAGATDAAEPAPAAVTVAPAPPPAAVPAVATSADAGAGAGPSTVRILGISLAGVGAVGVAIGAVLAFEARSNNNQALGLCQTTVCDTQDIFNHHQSLVNDANRDKTGAIVAFAVGGAVLAGGVVLALTAAPQKREGAAH